MLPVHCTSDSDSRSPPGLACFSLWWLPACQENGTWELWADCGDATTWAAHSRLVVRYHWGDSVVSHTWLGRGTAWDLGAKVPVLCDGAQRNTHICWENMELAGRNNSVPSPDEGGRPLLHYNSLYGNWGLTGTWNSGKNQYVGRLEVHSSQQGWTVGMQTDKATPGTASFCKTYMSVQSCYPQVQRGFHSVKEVESLVKVLHNLLVASLNF